MARIRLRRDYIGSKSFIGFLWISFCCFLSLWVFLSRMSRSFDGLILVKYLWGTCELSTTSAEVNSIVEYLGWSCCIILEAYYLTASCLNWWGEGGHFEVNFLRSFINWQSNCKVLQYLKLHQNASRNSEFLSLSMRIIYCSKTINGRFA